MHWVQSSKHTCKLLLFNLISHFGLSYITCKNFRTFNFQTIFVIAGKNLEHFVAKKRKKIYTNKTRFRLK